MKKLFVAIAAVALTLSASCTKADPEEASTGKISFNVASYVPATKADSYASLVGETTTFKSKAFLHAVGVEGVQNFFGTDGETITANDATNPSAWLPSHDYYWPKSSESYINFVSWYDNSTTPDVTETSITWTNRTIAANDNIMWADEAWRFNQNNTPGTYKKDAVTEGVPTLFHHALAKLAIKAKAEKVQGGTAAENKTTWDVTLENIKITNTSNVGTLTLTNTDPTNTKTTVAYTGTGTDNVPAWAPGAAADVTMNNTSPLTTEFVNVLEEQSVLPQTLNANAKLTFVLHIITKYDSTQYSEEKIPVEVVLNTLGTNPITAWEMNTKYTYNIIVNPETTVVKFDPAVVDWVEDTQAPTYTVPANL